MTVWTGRTGGAVMDLLCVARPKSAPAKGAYDRVRLARPNVIHGRERRDGKAAEGQGLHDQAKLQQIGAEPSGCHGFPFKIQRITTKSVFHLHFCTVIVVEPVSGGLAESVAVTVMVCDPTVSAAVFSE